ncbi:DUF3152 domain-containing protein [Streptomyces drozdowiczii]|uniref:DUF3152 domain-containing protein n=1 Tax=Streptomyces drozdowiczii TaxID=202862 RepID=A0ABY6PLD3_9ACTN|nr:DUF3152 domain-containing protein [Streptomyces drozdowiczii]MCX0247781.1 DUF3152 domain-containing protein [Streptomyces drozdowiczii]UZK52857.1 DUF3152 domain-containing protein [Streptomyces drozdowiczii]
MTGRPNAPRTHRASARRRPRAAVTPVLLALAAAALCLLAGHGLPGTSDPAATPVAVHGDTRSETPEATATASVPESGPGTFTVARADAHRTGGGRPYRVEVEDDMGVDPDEAAEQIAAILDDERGWAHGAGVTFRQVADDSATLVIRIATPDTADAICATGGLDTEGELNCRVGRTVAVNLKRWQLGSPEFAGPPEEYRALIINHEVGHWLGYGHRECPGPGQPAPVMMQQIKGLHGCVSNAWPYAADGSFLDGPKVP